MNGLYSLKLLNEGYVMFRCAMLCVISLSLASLASTSELPEVIYAARYRDGGSEDVIILDSAGGIVRMFFDGGTEGGDRKWHKIAPGRPVEIVGGRVLGTVASETDIAMIHSACANKMKSLDPVAIEYLRDRMRHALRNKDNVFMYGDLAIFDFCDSVVNDVSTHSK